MVPLQEHQRSAPVLPQQLLFALLQGQFRLSDLLALHGAPTLSNGLNHVINTGSLSPAHTLQKTRVLEGQSLKKQLCRYVLFQRDC